MKKDIKPVKSGWYNAFRPWSLHGAVIPVLIGGVVAYHDDVFVWWLFIMVLACGILLQSAANLLNTYGDYVKGTDTVENETRSPELVSGTLKPKAIFFAGMACLGLTALCGLVFIWYIGWAMVLFGIAGLAGAGLYTVGLSYKYRGMGLISVFFMMGILMPLGTYYTMSGLISWEVLWLSLPNAFLITAVLSGNETRDYYEDKKANVRTLSSYLSYRGSMLLYLVLNAVAFPILAVLIVLQSVPWACALAFISLIDFYILLKNSKKAPDNHGNSRLLVPLCFKFNWHFGVLLTVGYLIGYYVIAGAI
ncbi:MAG: 1,4-dihydroxy-2-naphthoate octaprenyltransferase [Candidatus Methanoplasma sp.]|jgi:1,4-dihydroxy-2-naphthoate octaprenyltransferase|nr:1,4-dihydroxy-2-naphthoate octaprenyltransferase [Candidatus Methanoplasma sp.]